jgi:dTDP-4-dehydrorhamnose reductase
METQVLEILPQALVARTSAFFGPWDDYNFAVTTRERLASGLALEVCDALVSPTYVPDLLDNALDLLIDGECGIWHLANEVAVTWADFARIIAERSGLNADLIRVRSNSELGLIAARPSNSVLASERGRVMPSLESALDRFFAERPVKEVMAAAA